MKVHPQLVRISSPISEDFLVLALLEGPQINEDEIHTTLQPEKITYICFVF